MDNSNLIIRSATLEDINEIAAINIIGFADYMNSKMGKAYAKAFYRWFVNPKQNIDGISLIVCSENQIAGFVVGAKIGYQKFLNKRLLFPAAIGFISKPYLLFKKKFLKTAFLKIKNLFLNASSNFNGDELKGVGISLVGISVHPNYRGQKFGAKLIKVFEENALKKKYDYMRLTVLENNKTAIKMYSDLGWQLLKNDQGICSYFKILNG